MDCLTLGVFEPMISKIKSLKFATEAAITILRIDDLIKLKEEEKPPHGSDDESYNYWPSCRFLSCILTRDSIKIVWSSDFCSLGTTHLISFWFAVQWNIVDKTPVFTIVWHWSLWATSKSHCCVHRWRRTCWVLSASRVVRRMAVSCPPARCYIWSIWTLYTSIPLQVSASWSPPGIVGPGGGVMFLPIAMLQAFRRKINLWY